MNAATPPYSRPSHSSSRAIPIASIDMVQAVVFTPRSRAMTISSSSEAMLCRFIMERSMAAPIPKKFSLEVPSASEPDGVIMANMRCLKSLPGACAPLKNMEVSRPAAAAPVAITKAARTRSRSPLKTTRAARSSGVRSRSSARLRSSSARSGASCRATSSATSAAVAGGTWAVEVVSLIVAMSSS
jgi:hypothetical protein